MGTDVHLVLTGPGALDEAAHLAAQEIDRLESLWSRFRADSDLERINRHPGRPVMVEPETVNIVQAALDAYWITDGRFDPTVGGSLVAAGYDRPFDELSAVPHTNVSTAGARSDTPHTGAEVIVHSVASTVEVPNGCRLDLGGIAKGATADLLAEGLINGQFGEGIAGALVSIGGDLRAEGTGPDNNGWTVRLLLPGADRHRELRLRRGAVCTSSTTKRRWTDASGDTHHHLIDPTSRRSSTSDLLSASVIGSSAMTCDAIATVAVTGGAAIAGNLIADVKATGFLVDDLGTVIELDGAERFLSNDITSLGQKAET